MASAGRILIMPKGAYSASATYEMLDMVSYNGTSWLAKKTVSGIAPSDGSNEFWQNMFNMDAGDYLPITGGTLTGDPTVEKIIPAYKLKVTETSKAEFHKNASSELDMGTSIIDLSGNVQTVLVIQNGQLKLFKQVNGVEVASTVIAEV